MQVGKALPARRCSHPEMIVINAPKPPPAAIRYHCKCGANWGCPVCGWGAGSYPCACTRERMAAS